MGKLDFSDIFDTYDSYDKDFGVGTSPLVIGSKTAKIRNKKYLIVAVAVRGTQGDVGDFITDIMSGVFNADGFSVSGSISQNIVSAYCKERQKRYSINKKHTILFLTGHSLGAAIVGQVARASQGTIAQQDHIFAYTFASPYYKTYGKEQSFKNIHNYVNTEDAVPKFPLFGKRNGVDHTFKGNGDSMIGQHMLDVYFDGVSSCFNGKTKKASVKKSITLSEKRIEVTKGEKYKLIATVTGMKKTVTWITSNKRIATVKGGVITGKRNGTATITAKCGKLKAKCRVIVKREDGINHTEKGKYRFENYNSVFDLRIKIDGNKLIVEGQLIRSLGYEKGVLIPGKKHIFSLSPKTQYWQSDFPISKERFLTVAKEAVGEKWPWFILDMENGEVVTVGFAVSGG